MKSLRTVFSINFIIVFSFLCGCKKFIELDPPGNLIISEVVFENDSTAKAALTGIYSEMMNSANQFCSGAQTLYTGLYADELYHYAPSFLQDEYLKSEISQASHSSVLSNLFWDPAFKYIYVANSCIEKISASNHISTSVKNQLTGEALFVRAFCYFNLVNLFGGVPMITGTDYRENAIKPRASIDEVYDRITDDLEKAANLLSVDYQTTEKARPNKWSAMALLARVYLYREQWAKAEAAAAAVINSGKYSLVANLSNVFLRNSQEAILQLQPVNPNVNTWEGNSILPASATATPTYLVTKSLFDSIDISDGRKTAWIKSRVFSGQTLYYPFKYKVYGSGAPLTEYYMMLRLAEQYLIRAEAEAHLGDLQKAVTDVNIIRTRASLQNLSSSLTQDLLLLAIQKERRIELMFEWGHRWFDMKRTGTADTIMHAFKPTTWQSTDLLWPIPINQINANPNLKQNPGY